MTKSDSVTSYIIKVAQIRDQLAAVGEKVANTKWVNMALNGFLVSWEPFVKGICARENLPKFERLWDDGIQEETWMESKTNKKGGGENLALFGQRNKSKGKGPNKGKGKNEESTSQLGKKDLSKFKCFSGLKHGHYASYCPDKKKGKGK